MSRAHLLHNDQRTHAMFITALVIATPATALLYQALVYLTETYL